MSSVNELTLFDRYVSSEMNSEERNAFEQNLKNDPHLKTSFDEFRVTKEAINVLAHADMKAKMNTWKKEMDLKGDTEPKSNKGRLYALLALAIFLIGASVLYVMTKGSQNPTKESVVEIDNAGDLFAVYYMPPAPNITRGGGAENYDQKYLDGVDQRANKAFDQAIASFSAIPENHERYLEVQELLIDIYIEKGDFQKAERTLIQNMATENELFLQKGDWYRVMIELKQNDIPETERHLKKILYSKNHFYYTKASKLSEDLKKLN